MFTPASDPLRYLQPFLVSGTELMQELMMLNTAVLVSRQCQSAESIWAEQFSLEAKVGWITWKTSANVVVRGSRPQAVNEHVLYSFIYLFSRTRA
jgi:hypothetical protein